MKISIIKTGILILTVLAFQSAFGQKIPAIKKSDNSNLIRVLNNSELLSKTKTKELSIKIFKVDSELPNTVNKVNGEITHDILIAVSEFDELPKQNLFEIGSFYNPKFKKWINSDHGKSILLEYGLSNKRNYITIEIGIEEVKFKNESK